MKETIHIINAMQIGGVEVGVLSLLKSKINTDYKVITIRGCDDTVYNSLTSDEKSRLYVCDGYFKVLLLLMKLKPKIIISSLWRAHLVSLMFKLIKPSIKRIHFVHNARFAHLIDNISTRVSYYMADVILCDSKQSQAWFKKVIGDKTSVIVPMNVSFSNEKKIIELNLISFVFVGRFCIQKDLLKSIQFIKQLKSYGLSPTFDLYGRDDGELELLTHYVATNGLASLVNFHSTLLPTEIEAEMRKYNYYLQTSLAEGMAISVFQAIKNGLLPVITPVGEIQNYTRNGFNAIYLDANNINKSARFFYELIRDQKIEKFQVGCILNKENYPEFDTRFFSVMMKYSSEL